MSQNKLGMGSFGTQLAPGPSSASLAPQSGSAYSPSRGEQGSSFVMGGAPLSRPSSPTKSSHQEERYSSHVGRSQGGGSEGEGRGTSLFRAVFGGRGEKIMLGLFLYGLVLITIVYVIVTIFGDDTDTEYYSRPAGMDETVRPLWDR